MLTRFFNKPGAGKDQAIDPTTQSPLDDGEPSPYAMGEVIAGRYQIEEVLSGSMGWVYIARRDDWDLKVAIKVPRQEIGADIEGKKAILREANSWIRLGMHPNIACCYYVLVEDGLPYIFIEHVDGGDLAEWISHGRCRDVRTALSLAIQFCHGMEYTHGQGLIHRDIKPQNILITKGGLVKITDFGIVLSQTTQDEALPTAPQSKNEKSRFRGTPAYASPEQFVNSFTLDRRSDIFSFGICLWLLFTETKPFRYNWENKGTPEPMAPAGRPSLPAKLAAVLKHCVAFRPEQRFGDFSELRTALTEIYLDLFHFPCPYAEIGTVDAKASGCNNQGVSYMELGRPEEARQRFDLALEANDVLPEALYNRILLQWLTQDIKTNRLLRQLNATAQATDAADWFTALRDHIALHHETPLAERGISAHPPFRLCLPQKSSEIYQQGQLLEAVRKSSLDHLKNGSYGACQESLLAAWKNNHFRRDHAFTLIYEQLLSKGIKKDLAGMQRLAGLPAGHGPVDFLHYLPGCRKLVAGRRAGTITLTDFSARSALNPWRTTAAPLTAMAVSTDGKSLAWGLENGGITIAIPDSNKAEVTFSMKHPITSLAFRHDDRVLAAGDAEGELTLIPLDGTRPIECQSPGSGGVRSLCFLKRRPVVLAGCEDGAVHQWDSITGQGYGNIEAHAQPVTTIAQSGDGKHFATAAADRLITLRDADSGLFQTEIRAHEETISALLAPTDSRYLISACEDDCIKIWDYETGAACGVFAGRGNGIMSLAAGPRSHLFLAGRQDGGVTVWMLIYRLIFDRTLAQ